MKYTLFFIGFLVVAALLPHSTYAYFTTNQTALMVGDHAALYLIDFTFGHRERDISIPIRATDQHHAQQDTLTYALIDDEDEVVTGSSMALVLSTATVRNDMYRIPAGSSATFTLLVFFDQRQAVRTPHEARLQVTNLPFRFDQTELLALNPSELQYYTTEFISFE